MVTREERAEAYLEFLREEGFKPEIDNDGDVKFKYEGKVYYIMVDSKDEEFFRIVFPNFWSIDSEEERVKVHAAALKATADTKVAKVYPNYENTWAAIEMFVIPHDAFKPMFQRSIGALQSAAETFRKLMQEEESASEN